jgi:rod shape-determining protein MreD
MSRYVKYVLISIVLLVVQTVTARLLLLEGITPDILTIWIVYIALKEGQTPAMLWGFGIGLLFDLITGNFIGLSALTKTLCGFCAGYFFNENKTRLTLGSYRFLVIVFISSLVQNTIYFIIFTRGTDIGLARAVFEFGLATTIYTATTTLLPMFAFARKHLS